MVVAVVFTATPGLTAKGCLVEGLWPGGDLKCVVTGHRAVGVHVEECEVRDLGRSEFAAVGLYVIQVAVVVAR